MTHIHTDLAWLAVHFTHWPAALDDCDSVSRDGDRWVFVRKGRWSHPSFTMEELYEAKCLLGVNTSFHLDPPKRKGFIQRILSRC